MSEYIKREDAIKAISEALNNIDEPQQLVEAALSDVPAADVKPAVSCKDCEYSRMCSQYIDVFDRHYHIGFCSIGERSGLKK